jgi:hypothetical protein
MNVGFGSTIPIGVPVLLMRPEWQVRSRLWGSSRPEAASPTTRAAATKRPLRWHLSMYPLVADRIAARDQHVERIAREWIDGCAGCLRVNV